MGTITTYLNSISHMIPIFLLVIIGIFLFLFIDRNDKVKELSAKLEKLNQSFEELDDQAKIIIKTDLELNKTQEKLDKRLNGLDALQQISRFMSNTLDENEIFQRLQSSDLIELGFDRILLITVDEDEKAKCRVRLNFEEDEIDTIYQSIKNNESVYPMLQKGGYISSTKSSPKLWETLSDLFKVNNYVLTPILVQNEMLGFMLAGIQSDAFNITEGDEELISILSDQIGQSIENARLFEQSYNAKQTLELKVQERTKQLSQKIEEVNEISQNKSDFISAVSHELRTPLTSIKGYAAILMTGKLGAIPEKVSERLEKINKHSDNLVKLINDLLDISRIESGRVEIKFVEHDLVSIVENVQDLLTPQLKRKDINFVMNIEETCPRIMVDVSQIERVFINLIGNAIKFTPENGTITVNISLNKNKGEILCSVIDTGIGIKEEEAAKLFNEFYRVENEVNQSVKGTGLGLALAKKIVEAHNGKIWAAGQLNKGSAFHFTLPIEQKADTGLEA